MALQTAGPTRRHAVDRARHRSFKIVVTGPFDAGKTTLIRTISEIAVVSTERDVSTYDHGVVGQRHSGRTTVAMDFGRVSLADDLALHLFGTPGQERFEFMWQILAEGMLGFVLVVDASRPETIAEAREQHLYFRDLAEVPLVVAVNKLPRDRGTGAALTRIRRQLGLPDHVPVLAADARRREEVKAVLVALLRALLRQLPGTVTSLPAAVPDRVAGQ
ncbi:ATP/GTP-binding protein [Egicoccus sp. AB-alg2]|uniref:GTP-binding protein n=1 Tax=Egicoccus sp. AB-alg2 TaxID=3242693 RepID=UPI00359E49C1